MRASRVFATALRDRFHRQVKPRLPHAQPSMPVIGFLDAGSAAARTQQVAAFRKGLAEAGFQEGQNIALEFRWAEGQYGRFSELEPGIRVE